MTTRIENGVTVVSADEGKDLYNNFLDCNAGKECWLGYIYYDQNSNLLDPPYLLTVNDFSEIDEEVRPEHENVMDVDAEDVPAEEPVAE